MRIALVSDNYPSLGQAGGIGTYTRTVARYLSRRGHDVHVFAGGGRGVAMDEGVTRHLVTPVGDADAVGHLIARNAAQQGPFDVLEAPEFRGLGAVAVGRRDIVRRLAIRLHGAETILGHRPDMWRDRPENPERAVACAADVVTAPSWAAVQMTDDAWGTRLQTRAVIVPNPGPDIGPRTHGGKRYDVAFFGRLEPRKGVDVVSEALTGARRRLSLVVAGADHPWGGERTGLGLLRATGAQVTYLGVLDHPDVMAALARARVAVVPSRRESFGLTLLEAMTAGVPAVGSDIPAFRELVGASGGVTLLPLDDPGAWSAQIVRLLDDPELAREAARAARHRAEDFTPSSVTQALLEAWTSPVRRPSLAG
jgi:glycosyltransferase involved in cell wall biosynthesis